MSEHDIRRIRQFLEEKDIQPWLRDIDGMARAMDWASKELVIDSGFVFSVLMDIAREMHESDDSERAIDNMEYNPDYTIGRCMTK